MTPLSTDPRDIVRAAVYARQSKRRTDASEASPEAQLGNGESLASSRGWKVAPAHRFADIGRSGWDPSIVRPEYEALMQAVENGEVDVVIVNELSRLTRQGAFDAMKIDQKLKQHGVRLVSVQEPFLDTSNPVGEAIFALIAALAKQDSDIKAARIQNTKSAIQAVGGRHSSSAPYGMRTRREQSGKLVISVLEPDPETADIVRRAALLATDGFTFGQIADEFNDENVQAPGASEERMTEARAADVAKRRLTDSEDRKVLWRPQTVRNILVHPAIGGFATERKPRGPKGTLVNVIARNAAGKPLEPHTGLVTGAEWLALQEVLEGRVKPNRKPLAGTPTLLSGWRILSCGICAGSMGRSTPMYMCANPVGHGGLSIQQDILDTYVAQRVWARLTTAEPDDAFLIAAAQRFALQKDASGLEAERQETQAHLTHVRSSIHELQEDRKAGLYRGGEELELWRATLLQYREYEDTCTARMVELEKQSIAHVQLPNEWNIAEDVNPTGPGTVWASWDVYARRTFIALFVSRIRVGKGRDESKRILPVEKRVTIEWLDE